MGSNKPCIDASNALDRMCHSKPFRILSERDMCPSFRRLIFNMYRNQNIQVRWSLCVMYSVFKNGVKQGAMFSPVLFIVYIDSLLQKLQNLEFAVTMMESMLVPLDTLMILSYWALPYMYYVRLLYVRHSPVNMALYLIRQSRIWLILMWLMPI